MAAGYQKTREQVVPESGKQTGEKHSHETGDDCRCKEASDMTPRELLGLMFKDLAFWKKSKKSE